MNLSAWIKRDKKKVNTGVNFFEIVRRGIGNNQDVLLNTKDMHSWEEDVSGLEQILKISKGIRGWVSRKLFRRSGTDEGVSP